MCVHVRFSLCWKLVSAQPKKHENVTIIKRDWQDRSCFTGRRRFLAQKLFTAKLPPTTTNTHVHTLQRAPNTRIKCNAREAECMCVKGGVQGQNKPMVYKATNSVGGLRSSNTCRNLLKNGFQMCFTAMCYLGHIDIPLQSNAFCFFSSSGVGSDNVSNKSAETRAAVKNSGANIFCQKSSY